MFCQTRPSEPKYLIIDNRKAAPSLLAYSESRQFWYPRRVRKYLVFILALSGAAAISISAAPPRNELALLQQAATPAQQAPAGAPATAPQQAPGESTTPPNAPPPAAKPVAKGPRGVEIVVLDPAHGGSDSGARGGTGLMESDIVLDFARALRVTLEAQGFRVLLTREGNQDPSFDDRSALINGLPDAIFISLHVSSTGPPGTARAYSFDSLAWSPVVLPTSEQQSSGLQRRTQAPSPHTAHPGLIEWDRAQQSHSNASRRFAELMQIQLAQRFKGSPELPSTAAVRQLRTIAAPAIAIEVSNVAALNAQRLGQMTHPLAEAVARAAVDFALLQAAAVSAPLNTVRAAMSG